MFHRNDSYHGDSDSELLNISALVVKEWNKEAQKHRHKGKLCMT